MGPPGPNPARDTAAFSRAAAGVNAAVSPAIVVVAPGHGTLPERKELSGKGQLLSKENRWETAAHRGHLRPRKYPRNPLKLPSVNRLGPPRVRRAHRWAQWSLLAQSGRPLSLTASQPTNA